MRVPAKPAVALDVLCVVLKCFREGVLFDPFDKSASFANWTVVGVKHSLAHWSWTVGCDECLPVAACQVFFQ